MTRAELTEAVARAMYARSDWRHIKTFDACDVRYQRMWLEDATAALAVVAEAMREPTKRMEAADPYGMGYGRLQAVWNSLIAASPLAEDKP